MLIFESFIRNAFYQSPMLTLLIIGGLTLLIGFQVFRQLFYWLKYRRNKRKVLEEIQQHLSKK